MKNEPLNSCDEKPAATASFKHIRQATLILMAGTAALYGLSLFKSFVIASYYGTSAQLDAYFLAFAPFNLISGVVVSSIQAAVIPKYLEVVAHRGKEEAFAFLSTICCFLLAIIMAISLFLFFGNSVIARYLGSGFDAPHIAFTAALLRASTILLLLTIVSETATCLFQAHRQFAFVAFAPLISGIFSFWYMIQFQSDGVISLMHGLIGGMCLQSGVILYAARQFFPVRFRLLSPFHPDVKQGMKMMTPLFVGSSFGHINMVVDQMMASRLPAGSIAALNYAAKLHSMLTQMFIMMASKAMLPFLAQQAAENDFDALKATFFKIVKTTLIILLPISAAIILFGRFAIEIFFQRGAFTAQSTSATAGAWTAYTLGLPLMAVGILAARMYNVLQENPTLMYVAGGSVAVNIVLNWIFMHWWGHIGIALSTSVVACLSTGVLLAVLSGKINRN